MFQVSWLWIHPQSSIIFHSCYSFIQFDLQDRPPQSFECRETRGGREAWDFKVIRIGILFLCRGSPSRRKEHRAPLIPLSWRRNLGEHPRPPLESCKHLVLDHSDPLIQDGNLKETWSFRWPWTWRALGWFAKGIMLVGPVTGLLEAQAYGMLLRQDCFKNDSEQTQTMWHDCGWILSSSLSGCLGLLKGNYIQANFNWSCSSMLYKPMANLGKRRFQTKAP